MSKSALIGLARGLSRDLGPRGITINNVQPGPTDTDMNPADGPDAARLHGIMAIPRHAHGDEIAAMVAYLASPEAATIWAKLGGFSKKESADLVDLVFETIKETLGRGEKIKVSGFGNFALSFSVISILTGAVSLYGYGLRLGGPIEMTVGWPIVSIMTLFVAVSLAELASAYPTAGALYHWASILGGARVGWWTAWLNLIGQVAVLAGVDYAFADFLREALGVTDDAWHLYLLGIYALVLVTHYQRLLNYIVPDFVHVLAGGRIVKSGDKSLALELEARGYDWLLETAA